MIMHWCFTMRIKIWLTFIMRIKLASAYEYVYVCVYFLYAHLRFILILNNTTHSRHSTNRTAGHYCYTRLLHTNLMFCGPCIMIYLYEKNQQLMTSSKPARNMFKYQNKLKVKSAFCWFLLHKSFLWVRGNSTIINTKFREMKRKAVREDGSWNKVSPNWHHQQVNIWWILHVKQSSRALPL